MRNPGSQEGSEGKWCSTDALTEWSVGAGDRGPSAARAGFLLSGLLSHDGKIPGVCARGPPREGLMRARSLDQRPGGAGIGSVRRRSRAGGPVASSVPSPDGAGSYGLNCVAGHSIAGRSWLPIGHRKDAKSAKGETMKKTKKENEQIAEQVEDAMLAVHRALGPGLPGCERWSAYSWRAEGSTKRGRGRGSGLPATDSH
jgi:hypothetical protein